MQLISICYLNFKMSLNKNFLSDELSDHFLDAESSFSRTSRLCKNNKHRSYNRNSASPAHSTNSFSITNKQQNDDSLDERSNRSLKTNLFQITQGEYELKRRLSTASDLDKNIKNLDIEDEYDIYKQVIF